MQKTLGLIYMSGNLILNVALGLVDQKFVDKTKKLAAAALDLEQPCSTPGRKEGSLRDSRGVWRGRLYT